MVHIGWAASLAKHLDEIKRISDQQFGDGYIPRDKFRNSLQAGGDVHLLVAFKIDGQTVLIRTPHSPDEFGDGYHVPETADAAGFCMYLTYDHDLLADYLNIEYEDYPDTLQEADEVGIPRSVAVGNEHQGEGIGTELVTTSIDILEREVCDALCVVGWDSPDGVRLEGTLRENGFEQAEKHENYWYTESKREEYECGACGEPPCQCDAVLYVRDPDCETLAYC